MQNYLENKTIENIAGKDRRLLLKKNSEQGCEEDIWKERQKKYIRCNHDKVKSSRIKKSIKYYFICDRKDKNCKLHDK